MVWKPNVTVAAVIQRDDAFLLVEEHVDGRLVLNQPAGHLEASESLLEAVVREVREETAWRFHPTHLVGIYRWQHPTQQLTFLRVCVTGDVNDHREEQPLDPDIERTVWLPRDRIAAQAARLRSPMVMQCVDDHAAGRRYPLDILIDLPDAGADPTSGAGRPARPERSGQ